MSLENHTPSTLDDGKCSISLHTEEFDVQLATNLDEEVKDTTHGGQWTEDDSYGYPCQDHQQVMKVEDLMPLHIGSRE